MPSNLFPPRPVVRPTIYAYEETNPQYAGLLKVGYTAVDVQQRVAQQFPTLKPGPLPYRIVVQEAATRNDGTGFKDFDVHRVLRKRGIANPKGEWFQCTPSDVRAAILAVRDRTEYEANRSQVFKMRPEQTAAVERTAQYFVDFKESEPDKTPRFLWNAKMRFGKTFAAYQLAKKLDWKKVLVLTFKPAVVDAWKVDLQTHVDFEGWQFISLGGLTYDECDKKQPIVCFGSFQDYLGKDTEGRIKAKNEWVHATNWDCVIFDEYHYGAWRDRARDLFTEHDQEQYDEYRQEIKGTAQEWFDEDFMPITTGAYLYLSGTPFRAIASGEFIEEQIYNWTYSDEQNAKETWDGPDNPYAALPRIVMLTYKMPPEIENIALQGEFNEFDLNTFFSAEGSGNTAAFTFKSDVQKWLDLIRGAFLPTTVDNLKMGAEKPPMPYSHKDLVPVLTHTLWFFPSVAACHAMKNLLAERQNVYYHGYKIVVAAGADAGIGERALGPVRQAMGDNPLETKTITLSCGKLTTGVSIKPWTGIFMLRNTTSPETYFQAAFRVQTPWTVSNPDGVSPEKEEIIKKECYIFDFAPNRALRKISEYSCHLNAEEPDQEKNVADFIRFLPVLAYDGSYMEAIDAARVLQMAMTGTTATLLAKRWQSALLVNVDNDTLARILASPEALKALDSIEAFRNIREDIETIINKSAAIKKAKKEAGEKEYSEKEKRELTEAEKEYKSKRKEIQEKLIKFATRIPIFMYLTDFRERTLKDVITKLEPGLFKKVTGLTVKDFDLLVSLGVFNSVLMNDAVGNFKRYEDSSLSYTGVDKHEGADVGLYDTVISAADFKQTFQNIPGEGKKLLYFSAGTNLTSPNTPRPRAGCSRSRSHWRGRPGR